MKSKSNSGLRIKARQTASSAASPATAGAFKAPPTSRQIAVFFTFTTVSALLFLLLHRLGFPERCNTILLVLHLSAASYTLGSRFFSIFFSALAKSFPR